ncbi:MAG TPA: hypothetical protein VLW49_07065 [Gaiellaceae bacterium]|nr:hypothetical protein [Gaiellaceae bacterium]
MREPREPTLVRAPHWVSWLFGLVVVFLIPWTVYLTLTLPARHVTYRYDLAWVGFDVGLIAAFLVTTWAAFRGSKWLVPLAAVAGTMLLCDAWFDIVTSQGGGELWEAVGEAAAGEIPLAAICGFIVYDAETFLAATVTRFRRST